MDFSKVAVGDVALIPLIVGLIQFFKSFVPAAPGNVWRAASFILGLCGQLAIFVIAHDGGVSGWDLGTWLTCAVTGFAFALAAGKAYDEVLRSTPA